MNLEQEINHKWFLATIQGVGSSSSLSCGHIQWTKNYTDFEIWINISGTEYGYIANKTDNVAEKILHTFISLCDDVSVTIPVQEHVSRTDKRHLTIYISTYTLVLDFTRRATLDTMTELYTATMQLFSFKLNALEDSIENAQTVALSLIEKCRNGVILEINKRNERITELEKELECMTSHQQPIENSLLKTDHSTQSTPLNNVLKHSASHLHLSSTTPHKFLGINTKCTQNVKHAQQETEPESLLASLQPSHDTYQSNESETDNEQKHN